MSIAGYVPSKKPVINFDFVNGEYHGGPIYGQSDGTATHVNKNGEVRPIDYWNSAGAGNSGGNQQKHYRYGHRIDYDPYTGECKGLLLEGTKTNQLSNHVGSFIGNYNQTDQGLTICGPDGNNNSAREFTPTSSSANGGSTLIVSNANLGVNGSTTSMSIFVKVTRGDYISFRFNDNNNNINSREVRVFNTYGDANYADAELLLDTTENSGTISFDRYRNGWVRLKWEGFIGSVNSTSYMQLYALKHKTTTGSEVGYAVWGAQVETSTHCSSPILTTGSSLSRNRDVFQWYGNQQSKNNASFYDVFNKSSEFTIFTDIEYLSDAAANGTSSNAGFDLWYDNSYKFSHRRGQSIINYSGSQKLSVAGSPGYPRREKIATSVRDYRTLRSKNGVLYSPITTQGNLSGELEESYGGKYRWTRLDGRVDSTDVFCHNGHLKRLIIWNDALSGDEIRELTKL